MADMGILDAIPAEAVAQSCENSQSKRLGDQQDFEGQASLVFVGFLRARVNRLVCEVKQTRKVLVSLVNTLVFFERLPHPPTPLWFGVEVVGFETQVPFAGQYPPIFETLISWWLPAIRFLSFLAFGCLVGMSPFNPLKVSQTFRGGNLKTDRPVAHEAPVSRGWCCARRI